MLHSQACDGTDFSDQYGRAMAKTAGHQFFDRVLPECNSPPASIGIINQIRAFLLERGSGGRRRRLFSKGRDFVPWAALAASNYRPQTASFSARYRSEVFLTCCSAEFPLMSPQKAY